MTDTDAKRRTGRGVKIALGVSLAVNLLVIGLVGGAVLGKDRAHMVGRDTGSLRSLGPIVGALDETTRDSLSERLRQSETGMRRELRGLVTATRAFQDALRAEPFDRASAEEALLMQRDHVLRAQEGGHSVLLDELEAMTPEARLALAERLQDRLRRIRPRDQSGDRDENRAGDTPQSSDY